MASPPSRARLFVALDLPDDARAAVVEWRERALGGDPGLRLVDPAALHVTLLFLGYLPEERVDEIATLVRAATPDVKAPVLSAKGVEPIPPRRPRLFALDLTDAGGRAAQIQAELSGALEAAHRYEPEPRPFWPHVTLARVRPGAQAPAFDAPEPPAEQWKAEAVTLYRSRATRAGARYEALARVVLA